MQAAANIAWALKAKTADTGLVLTLPEANSFGLAMLDPQPLSAALAALESGDADTLVVLENDLERRAPKAALEARSEEHTSELQSLMRISYAVFCLKKKYKHK